MSTTTTTTNAMTATVISVEFRVSVIKAQQLLQSMEDPDESTQMSAVIELCQVRHSGRGS